MALTAAWFWLMLVPEITTAEGIPHGLRLIGVIPALFILPAWLADKIWQKMKKLDRGDVKVLVAVVFLAGIFFYNFYLYFGVAASSPEYYYAFRSDLTVVSDYLNARNSKNQTYLALDKFSVQTVDYLTTETNNPYQLLVPEKAYAVRLKKGDQIIFTQSSLFDRLKFLEHHPEARLMREEQNKFGQIIMLVYQNP